jgi:hypothetical protein
MIEYQNILQPLKQGPRLHYLACGLQVVDNLLGYAAVGVVIGEGMQNAIAHLDEGDIRRAERSLRHARSQARTLNYDLEDDGIAEDIRRLEAYLAEVQARGMNQLDRKILRSGLYNQFELPVEEEDEDN